MCGIEHRHRDPLVERRHFLDQGDGLGIVSRGPSSGGEHRELHGPAEPLELLLRPSARPSRRGIPWRIIRCRVTGDRQMAQMPSARYRPWSGRSGARARRGRSRACGGSPTRRCARRSASARGRQGRDRARAAAPASSVAAKARDAEGPRRARPGPDPRGASPCRRYPFCSCFTSISDSAPSSKTTMVIGRRSRATVSSSDATIRRPPSPVKQTTRRSGWTSCAAMAAGSAKPIVARPFEMRHSPGSTACQ